MGLPPNWEEVQTEEGQTYYFNAKTNETRWDAPEAPAESPISRDLEVHPSNPSTRCECCLDGGFCSCFLTIGWRGRVRIFANGFTSVVALLHLVLFIVETLVFNQTGRGLFGGLADAVYNNCDGIFANEGIYNLCFAVGLLWGVILSSFSFGKKLPHWRGWGGAEGTTPHQRIQAFEIKIFFLVWAIAIGIFGGLRVTINITLIQAVPAFVALVLVCIGGPGIENG